MELNYLVSVHFKLPEKDVKDYLILSHTLVPYSLDRGTDTMCRDDLTISMQSILWNLVSDMKDLSVDTEYRIIFEASVGVGDDGQLDEDSRVIMFGEYTEDSGVDFSCGHTIH